MPQRDLSPKGIADAADAADAAAAAASTASQLTVAEIVFTGVDYTIPAGTEVVLANATGGNITIIPPAAPTRPIYISRVAADISGNTVTINPTGPILIDNGPTLTLDSNQSVILVWDGTEFNTIGSVGSINSAIADAASAASDAGTAQTGVDTIELKFRRLSLSAAPEGGGNTIVVTVAVTDNDAAPVAAPERLFAYIVNAAGDIAASAAYTIAETGAGSNVWPAVGGGGTLLFATDAAGAASLTVTDVAPANVPVRLYVEAQSSGGTTTPLIAPTSVELTFAP